MVGWKYRGTFPSLWFSDNSSRTDYEEVAEKDAEAKLVSKKYADASRGAKESDIGVGDIVLLAQPRKSKVDPTFPSERYTVIAREGAKVVVMSRSGLQYGRNIREVKRAPDSNATQETHEHSDTQIADEIQTPINEDYADLPGKELEMISNPIQRPTSSGSKNLRQRMTIKRPARFDDEYIYRVFC